MERHAVPQNIMEVEFKLFGALTIKQFAYLAAGFVAALLIYFTGLPFVLRLPLVIFCAILGLVLALLKINGQPASVFISNFILAMFTSQQRVWQKSSVTPDVLKEDPSMAPQIEQQIVKKVQKETKKLTGINTIPLSGLSREVRTKVDEFEEQRLGEIDNYFNNEINQVNSIPQSSKATIRDEVVPPAPPAPVANPEPPTMSVAEDNLANNVNVRDEQARQIPVAETDSYSASFKPITENDVNPQPLTENQDNSKLDTIKDEITRLQKEMAELESEKDSDSVNEMQKEIFKEELVAQPSNVKVENKVSGVVVNKTEEPIADATVYIKDMKQALVRKVVTAGKGDFALTNPLPNGEYYVDIEAEGYKFGTYKITLDSKQLPYFKFKAK